MFGSSSLGLGYSLVFSEALLAPAILSVSARAGAIFLSLIMSFCVVCGNNTGDGTENKLGSWLMLTSFQTCNFVVHVLNGYDCESSECE